MKFPWVALNPAQDAWYFFLFLDIYQHQICITMNSNVQCITNFHLSNELNTWIVTTTLKINKHLQISLQSFQLREASPYKSSSPLTKTTTCITINHKQYLIPIACSFHLVEIFYLQEIQEPAFVLQLGVFSFPLFLRSHRWFSSTRGAHVTAPLRRSPAEEEAVEGEWSGDSRGRLPSISRIFVWNLVKGNSWVEVIFFFFIWFPFMDRLGDNLDR